MPILDFVCPAGHVTEKIVPTYEVSSIPCPEPGCKRPAYRDDETPHLVARRDPGLGIQR